MRARLHHALRTRVRSWVNGMIKTCEQSWQVDAACDGRLDALTRQTFAQHQRDCVRCATELRVLEQIRHELALIGASTDEMAVRRQRQLNHRLAARSTRSEALVVEKPRGLTLALLIVLMAAALWVRTSLS